MKKYHSIEEVNFKSDKLYLKIDGKPLEFKLAEISQRLADATEEQLKTYEISPSGYGIHWPLVDEDISIDGLLGITHDPNEERKRA